MKVPVRICTVCLVIYIVFCFLLTAIGFSDAHPTMMAAISVAGTALLISFFASGCVRGKSDVVILIGSFFVKIGYLLYRLIFLYGASITSPTLSTDAKRFWTLAGDLYRGRTIQSDTRFPYILNMEFHVFGKNIVCVFMFNILMTMLMAVVLIALLNKFEVTGKSRALALFVCALLPYEVIVSCSLLREPLYFFFIIISFYCYVLYIESGAYKYMLLSFFIMVPVFLLHAGYFPIIIVYFVDSFRHDRPKTVNQLLMRIILIAALVALLLFGIRMDSGSSQYVTRGVEGLIEKVTGESGAGFSDEAGSRYLTGLTINSVPTLIFFSPVRAVFFLFSPLPGNWRGLSDIVAFLVDSCVHFYVLYSAFRARRVLKKQIGVSQEENYRLYRILGVGLFMILVIAFVFCLNTNNSGTAIRHRDVLIGIEALLLGLSLMIRSGDFINRRLQQTE